MYPTLQNSGPGHEMGVTFVTCSNISYFHWDLLSCKEDLNHQHHHCDNHTSLTHSTVYHTHSFKVCDNL